jgi:hypothetical protein
MPERRTVAKDKREGKAPSTQAGEFVHEEIRKIRRGQHGARSPQQAIAIGLSKARRAGVAPARREKARPRRRLAKVPNMPMRRGKASGSLAVGRASRAPCRAPSSANPAARHRARRSRSRRDAPPRAAPRPLVPRPPERPRGRRAPRAALPQPRKRLGPERAADDNARCPKFRALSGVQDRSGPHPFRALARMARRLPTRAKLIGWRR